MPALPLSGLNNEQRGFIRDNYKTMEYKDIAVCLNTTETVIRNFVYYHCEPKRSKWDNEELKFFTENYGIMDNSKLCEYLNRSSSAVKTFASKCGFIKYDDDYKFKFDGWHYNKVQMLKQIYTDTKISMDTICYILNTTPKSIANHIYKYDLDIYRYCPKKFLSHREFEYLKTNYAKTSTLKIALTLGITKASVCSYAYKLGLKKELPKKKESQRKLRHWSDLEEKFIIENCGNKSMKYMAKCIGRSEDAIKHKIYALGLRSQYLKTYVGGNYAFTYNENREIETKLKYAEFWHHSGRLVKNVYGGF